MMNNDFNKIGLYEHNLKAYKKVLEAFKRESIVGIVHATGTGKSYIALQLAYDNRDKKIVYVVPSIGIIEHIKRNIESNPNLDFTRDFTHVEFRTYQSFINMDRKEIENLNVDLLILDEFHHVGAPIWGARINSIIDTHPNIKVFGMTAYTVRDRGSSYERDIAEPGGNELFSDKIVSRYDLCDAMMEGVLPKPIYKSAFIKLLGVEKELEKKVNQKRGNLNDYQRYVKLLNDLKKRIQEAPTIKDVLMSNLKRNGKYIYFCPPCSEEGTNDIKSIMLEAKVWLNEMGLKENEDYVFYQTTSDMKEEGQINREAFYNDIDLNGKDSSNKLRIMFAINQYNEGIHAPNIDGVIMGRGTSSDIIYFEQLGRALAVKGNTKSKFEEYQSKTDDELIQICSKRDIKLNGNESREEIIEKIIAPLIIDLTNNIEFIKNLEDNLKDRIKQVNPSVTSNIKSLRLKDASFDIEIVNQELYDILKYVSDRLTNTWEEMYEYARRYYTKHNDLEVPRKFKTNNGYEYDANGLINLGDWISHQRHNVLPESERGQLLSRIGMRFENKISTLSWEEMYEYAKKYYEAHYNLEVPYKFKTNNGYEYDANGSVNLGTWISTQRRNALPESERGQLLSRIGMRFENKKSTLSWEKMYEYAKRYYTKHNDLEVPRKFKTNNGYEYDANGSVNLGTWISTQRRNVLPESERGQLLSKIGMRFENKISTLTWEEMYEYAKRYYIKHNDLEVPRKFKTNNGYEYDANGSINLGNWLSTQRRNVLPESERGQLLSKIGMVWSVKKNKDYINNICIDKNINIDENKKVLAHISFQELLAKINYLEMLNIPIYGKDGKLHEIFSMSSVDMQEKYGIDTELLIEKYYNLAKKK